MVNERANAYIWLIRHSAVVVQPETPARDWRLSADGRFRCHLLAQAMNASPILPTRIVTSEEPKARETGAILADLWRVPWQPAPGLHEHDRHGVPFLDKAAFETAVHQFFTRPDSLVWGRETAVAARKRIETAVHTQRQTFPDDTLAIVTHGTVLSLLVHHYNPQPDPFAFWQALTLPQAFLLTSPSLSLVAAYPFAP